MSTGLSRDGQGGARTDQAPGTGPRLPAPAPRRTKQSPSTDGACMSHDVESVEPAEHATSSSHCRVQVIFRGQNCIAEGGANQQSGGTTRVATRSNQHCGGQPDSTISGYRTATCKLGKLRKRRFLLLFLITPLFCDLLSSLSSTIDQLRKVADVNNDATAWGPGRLRRYNVLG